MAPLQSLHSLLEASAALTSSAVFIYDTTPTAPFGDSLATGDASEAEIWQMQTRPGAGSALVGFVESVAFTSKGAASIEVEDNEEDLEVHVPAKRATRSRALSTKKAKATATADKAVSVLASTASLLSLVPSLLSLPPANIRPAVAIHVSAQTSSLATDAEGSATLNQVPDLASLFEGVQALEEGGWTGAVLLSETAEEAAFVGTAVAKAVTGAGHDLVNVFDGLTAGRQLSSIAASSASNKTDIPVLSTLVASFVPAFTYSGPASATHVLVLPASTYSSSAKAALAALANGPGDVGVVVVRVVKPWSAAEFLAALPTSTKTLHVFADEDAEQTTGPFYADVVASLLSPPGFKLRIRSLPIPSSSLPTVHDWAARILALSPSKTASTPVFKSILPEQAKLAVFWNLDSTPGQTELVPLKLAQAFAQSDTGVEATVETKYDNYRQGGVQQSALLLEPRGKASKEFSLSSIVATSPPSLLFLSSPAAVFKAYEPISLATVGPSTRIVISANWTSEEAADKLPVSAKQALASIAPGKGNVFLVDADKLATTYAVRAAEIAEIVFWSLYLPATVSAKDIVGLLASNPSFAGWTHSQLVEVNSAVRNALVQVEVTANWADAPMVVDGVEPAPYVPLPTALVATAAGPNADRTFVDPAARIVGPPRASWHQVAQRLMYPGAFQREPSAARPDLAEKTHVVTVSETRRLTPNTYDRNVFHIEFSTVGTGLTYAVGEALGIHGWNDGDEVREFIEWYGLDPEAVVSLPSRADQDGRVEQRTVFQLFQQNLDLFGKPGKAFYETLSRFAGNKEEERALRFIACPDGHATFKKMSETDAVTYVDLLRRFPSARPTVEDLVREVEEIKPRHYSIASSQNFVGDSVHLLVVTVEWQDPKGLPRFGQCTRYLAGLKAGDKVTVSVKPSVMKLPILDTSPIIMAGLGTGAAPFRAFIQERAWQKAQGREIGPSLYYFGSRYRSKEYLYGEEIEAYMREGIVTHAGLAFSRDTDKKIYIQHKMNEDAELLASMMETGTFYLCGPTWPVPDVYEALVKSFVGQGRTIEAAQARIEELKEDERYVLEVY